MSKDKTSRLLRAIENSTLKSVELSNVISEEEAAQLLGVAKKTLTNKVSRGLCAGLYTISPVTGKRFWYRDKILGL
ncbi:MAG: hypothetical protein ACTHMM_11990 [Agriterribacter sp.]